jgi:hypothetical protein
MSMIKASVKNNPASNSKPVAGKASILPLPQPGTRPQKVVPLIKPSK